MNPFDMETIHSTPGIRAVLQQNQFFTPMYLTRVELSKHLDRSRQSIGEDVFLIRHAVPESNQDFSYMSPRGRFVSTASLSPYVCWLVNRVTGLIAILGSRNNAANYIKSHLELFSRETYESELIEHTSKRAN